MNFAELSAYYVFERKNIMKKRCAAIILLLCTLVTVLVSCGEKPIYDYDSYADYIKLGNYKGITINQSEIDEGIEDQWHSTLSASTDAKKEIEEKTFNTPNNTDVLVQRGDTLTIDYEGTMFDEKENKDVAFDGGTAKDASLTIGSDTFIDGFEDGLINFAVGDVVTLNLKFPDPYANNPNYAGKDVKFVVTIKAIKRTVYPAYNDSNVDKYTDFKTVAEFEDSIKEDIVDSLIWEQLIEICKIKKYPEYELTKYYDAYVDSYTEMATLYGGSGDTMYSIFGYSTAKSFFQAMAAQAQTYVKQELIILAILEAEPSLELNDADFEVKVKELYDEAVANGEFDEDYSHFKKHNDEMTLRLSVYNKVIIDYIDNNKSIFDDITKNGFYSSTFGTSYYIDGEAQKGWVEIENDDGEKELYYFNEETGYAFKEGELYQYIDKNGDGEKMWYEFNNKGKLNGLCNGLCIDKKGSRYFNEGVLVTGWLELELDGKDDTGKETCYFDDEDGYMYLGFHEVKSEGKWYEFDEKSGILKSDKESGVGTGLKVDSVGTRYFIESQLQTGWQEYDLDEDGELDKCYFNPVNDGYMVVGDVCEIEKEWMEFDKTGIHQGKANGLVKTDLGTRYFVNGILQTGEQTVTTGETTNSYYFDPENDGYSLVSEWLIEKDPEDETKDILKFYYDGNGCKVTGKELSIDGTTYVFAEDGTWTIKAADTE